MKLHKLASQSAVSRLVAGAGALVSAAAVAATAVPAADAAITGGSAAPAVARSQPQNTVGLKGVNAGHQTEVIKCEMVYQGKPLPGPHNSGHQPGSVNVRVRVTCDEPVTSITGYVVLFQVKEVEDKKDHEKHLQIIRRSSPRKFANVGRAAANGNAALICKPGFYEGDSVARIVAPPGYQPHIVGLRDFSSVSNITSCP